MEVNLLKKEILLILVKHPSIKNRNDYNNKKVEKGDRFEER